MRSRRGSGLVAQWRWLRRALLSRLGRAHTDESIAPGCGHRKIEPVDSERQLDVGGRKARPLAGHNLAVTLALAEGLEQRVDVEPNTAKCCLDVLRAGVILGEVGGRDQRDCARTP